MIGRGVTAQYGTVQVVVFLQYYYTGNIVKVLPVRTALSKYHTTGTIIITQYSTLQVLYR